MRRIILAIAFCVAISPLAVSAQTTASPAKKHKAAKVKKHKAAKVTKRKVVKHTAA